MEQMTSLVGFDGSDHFYLMHPVFEQVVPKVSWSKRKTGFLLSGNLHGEELSIVIPFRLNPERFIVEGRHFDVYKTKFSCEGRNLWSRWRGPFMGITDSNELFIVCHLCKRPITKVLQIIEDGCKLIIRPGCSHCRGEFLQRKTRLDYTYGWTINGTSSNLKPE